MNKFEQPDFDKDSLKTLCKKIWLAGQHEFQKLNSRVRRLEDDRTEDMKIWKVLDKKVTELEKKVSNMDGKMVIIIGLLMAIAGGVFLPLVR